MSVLTFEAFADETTYQFNPHGSTQPRQTNVRLIKPYQGHDVQVFLVGGISKEFVVTQPLQLTIEQDDDNSFVVSDDVFLVYGDGNAQSSALNDYIESLIAYYKIVEDNAEKNDFDRMLLGKLQSYIQRRGSDAIQTQRS